jgi:hypothetical protein
MPTAGDTYEIADSARVTQAWSSTVAAVRIAWYALPDGA